MAHLKQVFDYVDENQNLYVERLSEVVAIQSVSAFAEKRDEVIRQVKHTEKELQKLGCSTELADVGMNLLQNFFILSYLSRPTCFELINLKCQVNKFIMSLH